MRPFSHCNSDSAPASFIPQPRGDRRCNMVHYRSVFTVMFSSVVSTGLVVSHSLIDCLAETRYCCTVLYPNRSAWRLLYYYYHQVYIVVLALGYRTHCSCGVRRVQWRVHCKTFRFTTIADIRPGKSARREKKPHGISIGSFFRPQKIRPCHCGCL